MARTPAARPQEKEEERRAGAHWDFRAVVITAASKDTAPNGVQRVRVRKWKGELDERMGARVGHGHGR